MPQNFPEDVEGEVSAQSWAKLVHNGHLVIANLIRKSTSKLKIQSADAKQSVTLKDVQLHS